MHLIRPRTPGWEPRVLLASALEGTGIDEVWCAVGDYMTSVRASGALATRRAEQAREWMWSEVTDSILERVRTGPHTAARLRALEADVEGGRISPAAAARRLLDGFSL